MIRNYFTTVLLIWFQGGFDALLYSFNYPLIIQLCFLTRDDRLDKSAVTARVHKGECCCKARHENRSSTWIHFS